MYFVNKQNIIFFKFSEQCSEIGFLLQHRTGGFNNIHPHFIGNYFCNGGFPQSRRPENQCMIQRFTTFSGGSYGYFKLFAHILLPYIIS